ncbi:MAG TPA: hypothetical protein VNK04_16875 [Gemmataceae bacterium]|nr:hypothetical protein [Gemmataceae bacterium]
MTQVIDQTSPDAPSGTDLVAAIHRVLAGSPEPLTVSKLRSQLPSDFRQISPEELTETLRRQVAAGALYQYPPYRSQQDRFWDRSMPVHLATLLRSVLEAGPLPWSQIRRRLPAYALAQAESVLQEQVAQGMIYRHPRGEGRGGDLFGLQPPDPKEYLSRELSAVFHRLEQLGFSRSQVRAAALELLHDEEWAPAPPAQRPRSQAEAAAPAAAPAVEEQPAPPVQPQAAEPGGAPTPNVTPGGEPPSA